MLNVDLKKLDDYVVISLGAGALGEPPALRVLERDYGDGVAALWNDERQGLVAFAFDPLRFNGDEARAWVKAAQQGDLQDDPYALDNAENATKGAPMPYKSLQDLPPTLEGLAPPLTLAQANLIAEWADAMEQAEDGPDNPWAAAIDNFKRTYTVKGDRWVEREKEAGAAEMHASEMHVFDSILAAASLPDADGLVWKEVIKPGQWYKMDSGRAVEITDTIIQEAYRAFTAGLPKFISVPAGSHHSETRGVVPATANKGFVKQLQLKDGGLYAGFQLTDPTVALAVQDGSIADCSVYLQPDVVHPATGEKYPWVLRHVLLTNNPLVPDLKPFGDIPADSGDGHVVFIHYRQAPGLTEGNMTKKQELEPVLTGADEIVLTGDAAREYSALAGLGLTAEEIKGLVAQRAAIVAQAQALRVKARSMEIASLVTALEANATHPRVTQIEGYRHYPVVINALTAALEAAPDDMALDDSAENPWDTALLSVVNALPETARIKLEQPHGSPRDGQRPKAADAVSDAQVDTFIESIGL